MSLWIVRVGVAIPPGTGQLAEAVLEQLGPLLLRASHVAYRRLKRLKTGPHPYGWTRKVGHDTPLWNLLRAELRRALKPYGSKARLARYLGVPRQRITDCISAKRRMPDAELTMRLLHWLMVERQGQDLST